VTPESELEAALQVWTGTAARRNERRGYEWKVTIGLWVGLLATSQFLLSSDQSVQVRPTHHDVVTILVIVGAALIVVGHWFWLFRFVGPSNHRDQSQAIDLDLHIRQLASIPMPSPAQLPPDADLAPCPTCGHRGGPPRPIRWLDRQAPLIFQLMTTVFLTSVLAFVAYRVLVYLGPDAD
jgi:hypothetical protein